jgi:2-keto-4-pentenoate hydratase/2-oxohepta-3-ene-1,7-dioic acid hydratase in catechol pathway
MNLGALRTLLNELATVDPVELADAESVVDVHRYIDQLQAIATRIVGAFDAAGAWQLDRSRTPAGWIMAHCRLPKAAAKAEVALARSLRHLPATETAWLAGDISVAHVRTLAAARRPATEEQFTKDEDMLVGQAKTLSYRHFAKVVDYWTQLADADGEDDKADAQRERRRCHLS